MDFTDEDIEGLIHSKFRKAKRGFSQVQVQVVSRLTTTSGDDSLGSTTILEPTETPIKLPTPPPLPSAFTSRESHRAFGIAHGIPQVHFQDNKSIAAVGQFGGRMRESIIAYGGPLTSPVATATATGTGSPAEGRIGINVSEQCYEASTAASVAATSKPFIRQSSSGSGSIVAGTSSPIVTGTSYHGEIFRFDSADRERYLCSAISEEEEVFSPGISPASSSPHILLDSSCLTSSTSTRVSPIHSGRTNTSPIHSGSLLLSPPNLMESQNRLMARVHTGLAMLPTTTVEQTRGLFGVPSSPVSPLTPNTPISPSSLFSDQTFQQGFLAELYRRRCHSDSDLPLIMPESSHHEPTDLTLKPIVKQRIISRPRKSIPHPLTIPSKGGSLESDQSSPQDSPLDLSVKTFHRDRFGSSASCESLTSRFISSLAIPQISPSFSPGVAVIHGDIASPTTRNSVAQRYNLDVSPVVEEMPPGADMAFVCPVCGQMFSLHDRLAKHMASRHKSKPHDPNKSYPCDVCHRSFARSDMLTRHMRLHTGVKPYTCRVCGQVFSRSDHLSTHQRTHTGEKPYKCPQCPYSACRRDMITRHLRTHTRNSSSSSSDLIGSSTSTTPTSTSFSRSDSLLSLGDDRPIKMEITSPSRSPSTSSSFAPDSPSPSSPALNLGNLSVHSPAPIFRKEENFR